MSTRKTDPTVVLRLPLWQILLVLVGLPAIYMANSLMPWSIGLLRRHDHAFFMEFWVSIAILHWGSVALVVVLLKRAGGRLADIGMHISAFRVAAMVGIPLAVGLALTLLHEVSGVNHGAALEPSAVVAPVTSGERLFWIFTSCSAGFCEELIYRGFGIRALQGCNVRTWLAVVLATLAFVLMHGTSVLARPVPFIIIYVGGLLFSLLFLWRRSLVPGICLHALFDMVQQ
jgi:membrane protease YdiL (CAAX protease family)